MNSNLPYIMIYKGDFLRGNVSACSIAAQGLWFRLMLLMHDSERTGYLCINGLPILSRIAAVKCAVSVDEYEALLAELMSVSAFSTSNDGIIFSPQLVAEAEARAGNAQRQKKHYDKKKLEKPNADLTPNLTATSRDKPSSSSSSNPFSKEKGGGGTNVAPAQGKEKPPPAAENNFNLQKRQWSELIGEEKRMDLSTLKTHLQELHPDKDVNQIAKKLMHFFQQTNRDFQREHLKGWVESEGAKITEAEFLAVFGDENSPEARRKAIEKCKLCDSNGYRHIGDNAKVCKHEKETVKT